MDLVRTASLIAATIANGLMAGLFFAFTFAVMPGLARTADRTFVESMQRINVAILNGWFLTCFLGALALSAAAAAVHLRNGAPFFWALAGFILYAATFLITIRLNVPLNDQLNAATLDNTESARTQFEPAWIRWNTIRTATSVAAFGCLVAALVVQ